MTDTGYAWIGLGLILVQLLMAIAVGWWVKQNWAAGLAWDEARAQQFCTRMHEIAQELAGNVGEHTLEIKALTNELESSIDPSDPVLPEGVILSALARIVSVNRTLEAKLNVVEERIQQQAQKLDLQLVEARVDGLTRLANRRDFDEELARRFADCEGTAARSCLLLIDIDHFKHFNDRYGHDAGDLVLQQVARRLSATMREMDLVARFGGDEFAVVMAGALADALHAAERARISIDRQPYQYDGHDLHVTTSIGLAEIALVHDTPAALFKRADEALYSAKQHGRNRGFYHNGQRLLPIPFSAPAGAELPHPKHAPQPAHAPAGEDACVSAEPSTADVDPPARRNSFTDALRRHMAQARVAGRTLSILLVGGPQGYDPGGWLKHNQLEAALRRMGEVVASSVRTGDVVTRYGWDQFAVILPNSNLAEAQQIERRVRAALTESGLELPGDTPAPISTGVAELLPSDDLVSLTRRASGLLERSPPAIESPAHREILQEDCDEIGQASAAV